MEIDFNSLYKYISIFFWGFTRISATIMVMPVFGTKMIPGRVKLMLSIILTVIFIPLCDKYPAVDLLSLTSFIIIIQQFIIGMAMGFVLQLIFQTFLLLGEIVAMQSSLSFALLNDPNTNSNTPVIGEIYIILVSCVFLLLDGHLHFCKLIFGSFQLLPIDLIGLTTDGFYQIVHMVSWMFASAIKIAMPAITTLLMVNIAFGVMTKAAPQLNIFAIGFPITMLVGIGILWFTVSKMGFHFERLFIYGTDFLTSEILRK